MIELLVGAGIAASYGTGHVTGRRRRKTATPPGPPPEVCQCGHGSAYHDRTGCRREERRPTDFDYRNRPYRWEVNECPCVRYVGPLSSYVPELDGEPAAGANIIEGN